MVGYEKPESRNRELFNRINIAIVVLVPILFFLLWEYKVDSGVIKENLLPAPLTLWKTFQSLFESGQIQKNLLISLQRVFIGFLVGSLTGVIVGFLMGLFSIMNSALTVFVNVLRPIPTIALIPIFILSFGLGEFTNVAVIFVGAFWPVLLNTISGIQSVDSRLLELAYVYRITSWKTVFHIIFPSSMVSIITGIRLSLGSAWMSVVAAEMIGASTGVGYMIMYSRELTQTKSLYVYVLIIGLVGLAFDRLLLLVQKWCVRKFKE
ncbi:MAG: ABC transporter permease [Clostridiales bacterium]|nr:ABC transporter permease [Clostridiales bacterium]